VPPGRRGFVKLAAVTARAGLVAGWMPSWAFASGTAEALMLSCIDYRFVDPQAKFMSGKGLDGEYAHVVLAGASPGRRQQEIRKMAQRILGASRRRD